MLILKLKLPEVSVTYNKVGTRTSTAVPFTPDKVKNTQLEFTIKGYQAPDAFYATKLSCPDKSFSLAEQITLLTQLGFKTLPTVRYPDVPGTVDHLIRIREQYAQYQPIWWNAASDQEYTLPEVATIESISWEIDEKHRLTEVVNTTKGTYYVLDMRTPEYFQPGLRVKVQGDNIYPYMSGPVLVEIPKYCPKCNNPLKKIQFSNDVPMIYKCVSPICKLLKTTTDSLENEVPDPIEPEELIEEQVEEVIEPEIIEEPVVEEPAELPNSVDAFSAHNTIDVSETAALLHSVINNDRIELDDELQSRVQCITLKPGEPSFDDVMQSHKPVCILLKTKRSITKVSKQLASATDLPMVPVEELASFLDDLDKE